MDQPTDIEQRAIELAYEKQNGSSLPFAQIPGEDQQRLLIEIRERVARIEGFLVHDLLTSKFGTPTKRRNRIAAVGFVMILITTLLIALVYSLLNRH